MTEGRAANSRALRRAREALLAQVGVRYRPGTLLPPIKKLADELECGRTNLHRAVQVLAAEGLLQTRRGVGTLVTHRALAGRERERERPLPKGDTRVANLAVRGKRVCIVTPIGLDGAVASAAHALGEALTEQGVYCEWRTVDVIHGDAPGGAPLPWRVEADALALVNVHMDWPATWEGEIPTALITTRQAHVARAGGYDVIGVDHAQAGYVAGQRARACGFTVASYMGSWPHRRPGERQFDATSALRLEGFEWGFGKAIPMSQRMYRLLYVPEAGAAAIKSYLALSPRPALVMTATDILAVGFAHAATGLGLVCGRDYYLLSIDGLERGRLLRPGALSTVVFPYRQMGEMAARLLVERMVNPDLPVRRVALGGELVEGATCRPVTRGRARRRQMRTSAQ